MSEKYRKMDEAFREACVMFGENPKTKEPSEFFQVFINFMNQFKVRKRLFNVMIVFLIQPHSYISLCFPI